MPSRDARQKINTRQTQSAITCHLKTLIRTILGRRLFLPWIPARPSTRAASAWRSSSDVCRSSTCGTRAGSTPSRCGSASSSAPSSAHAQLACHCHTSVCQIIARCTICSLCFELVADGRRMEAVEGTFWDMKLSNIRLLAGLHPLGAPSLHASGAGAGASRSG